MAPTPSHPKSTQHRALGEERFAASKFDLARKLLSGTIQARLTGVLTEASAGEGEASECAD
jgi:hypothetical protein